jgi:phosphate transport system permease protein
MKLFKKIVEKSTESVLFLSSTVTTLAVLFIVFFLFNEGLGIFKSSPVEGTFVMVVNKVNPVVELSSKEIKDVFNGDITNWDKLGGQPDSIILFTLTEIGDMFSEEELGANYEYMPAKIDSFITANPGVLGYFSQNNLPKNFHGKILPVANISLKEFFTGREWYPTATPAALYGTLPLVLGTLWVSIGAILLALPIGLITSVYMAEMANEKLRNILKPLIELLAGIPSVVYGFFGLVVLVPFIQSTFNLAVGETALAGSIILGIMALPTIITISEDAIRTTPVSLKEASLALGASRWQTIIRVILPYSRSGIIAASILGIGRAVGETMAVLMVTGNASVMPTSFLQPVRTIPATIAAELGEAPYGGVHFKALFALGIILFLITFTFNTLVELAKARKNKN